MPATIAPISRRRSPAPCIPRAANTKAVGMTASGTPSSCSSVLVARIQNDWIAVSSFIALCPTCLPRGLTGVVRGQSLLNHQQHEPDDHRPDDQSPKKL